MDFFLGRITREHDDIDVFVWAKDAEKLVEELQRAGFHELGGPPPEAQRNFTKDGEELQIALLDRNERGEVVVAGGPWAGAAWPEKMLEPYRGRIGEVAGPIVNPQAQIEIKERFREWRPDLAPRDKHQADVALLREAVRMKGDQVGS